jgi:flagellar assembly factor FliW
MATIDTQQFGTLQYSDDAIFEFPQGIPGFEHARHFVCVERPSLRPITFLQSIDDPGVCFITLPAKAVEPDYELDLAREDLRALGLAQMEQSLACLAIVCMPQDASPTANLLGPVVLSRETMRGVQAIREDTKYSAVHPLKTNRTEPHSEVAVATAATGEPEC